MHDAHCRRSRCGAGHLVSHVDITTIATILCARTLCELELRVKPVRVVEAAKKAPWMF